MSRCAITLLVAACARPAPPPAPIAEPSLFRVTDDAFGPLAAGSPATLAALRRAFVGYDVVPVNDESLELRVSQRGTTLFHVIPAADGTILNIHVVSPSIEIATWRVGAAFRADAASTCECWGDQTVCFREGDHAAVALAKICREGTLASAAARAALAGVAIRATIWSPQPIVRGGVPIEDDAPAGDPP